MVKLARRKGIRGKFTRNRSIALFIAVFAFAVVSLGIVDIGVDILGGGGFVEGTNFSVEILGNIIPLELVDNFAVTCSLWTEGDIVATDGTRRDIGFDTTVFRPQFSLDVFDPTTNKEIDFIEADIKLRCDSPAGLSASEFVLVGGQLQHIWNVANRATGQTTDVGSLTTISIQPNSNVLQSSTGSGILISPATITASTIDSAVVSSDPEYLVNLKLVIVANFIFEQRLPNAITNTKTVALVSQIGSNAGEFLRVQNEFIDPEPSASNIVDITETVTIPSPIFKSDQSPQVRICVDAPLYDSSRETRPRIDVFRPTADGSGTLTKFITNAGTFGSSGGQRFCTTIDLDPQSQMFVGNYRVEANMASRTGTDTALFTVYDDGQDPMTPIQPSPCEGLSGSALIQCAEEQAALTPDPCEGLTGSTLDQCLGIQEQFGGCSTGFKEVSNSSFLGIVAEIGTQSTIIIQQGFDTSDDPICLAEETIALTVLLAGEGDTTTTDICLGLTPEQCEVKLIGEPPTTTTTTTGITCTGGNVAVGDACVPSCAGLTDAQCSTLIASCATSTSNTVPECNAILKATQSTVSVVGSVSEEAKGLILYQIVFDGDDEVGHIENLQTSQVTFDPLEFAGIPSGAKEFFEFARLIINPVIDITNIAELVQTTDTNPQFTYTWTAEVTKTASTGATDVRELEKCTNNCRILDMKLQDLKVGGDQIQSVETEFRDKTFYWIAQSDIQPNELMGAIETAFGLKQTGLTPSESLDKFLDAGDDIKITLVVDGSFQPTITDATTLTTQKVRASISPMEWSHTFVWIPDFGSAREPCSGLSGQAQITCEGNPVAKSEACKDLTPEQCNQELPAKDPETGCKNTVVGLQVIRLCYGVDEEEEEEQSKSSLGSKSDGTDTEGKGSIVNFCPESSTVIECGKLALKTLEDKVSGILGLSSGDIQTISDNAVWIVGAVVGLLILAVIGRILINRRNR